MNGAEIAVILINYNSSEDTIACVNSILEKTSSASTYEIIVVDNASANEDFEQVLHLNDLEHVTLKRSRKNLGFGGGHMFGLQFTNSKYVLFLNNDCLFLNDVLLIMKNFMMENDHCGIASAQMYDTDGNWSRCFNAYQTIWIKLFGSGLFRKLNPKKYPNRNIQYEQPVKVDYVAGAFLMVDRDKFNAIGGFDTNIFLYFEEEDISLRMDKLGYDTYLVPQAKYLHHHGNSTPNSVAIQYELAISQAYLFRKHYSFFANLVFRIFYFFKYLVKGFKKSQFFDLAFFVARGAPSTHSLAHQQKTIQNHPYGFN